MKKKSQIRKFTVQKVKDILKTETNPEIIEIYI